MTVRANKQGTFAESDGGCSRPRPVATSTRDTALGVPATATRSVTDVVASTVDVADFDFDTWLLSLDESCAQVRRMARKWQITWHRRRLLELAGELEEGE